MIGYYERKIHYYKEQDRKAKGTLPKEGYMNVKWFWDNYIYNVTYIMDVDFVPVWIAEIVQQTCQRRHNGMTHTLDNLIWSLL